MIRTFRLASLVMAAFVSAPAFAADTYAIDSRHTFPVFEINHLGFSTQRGRFNDTSGSITLDTAAKKGAVDVVIKTGSIDMGLDKWDEHMRGEDFFNVDKFPTMSFKSDKFVFEGDKLVAVDGSFTLLGVTKPLRLVVSNFVCKPHPFAQKPACAADLSATVRRSEFGMTKYLPGVGDDVKLAIPVEAIKQ